MNLLWGLLVSGWESLWLITCCKHHIALFSLYEFFPLGFSYKVFNEAISTKDYVISSIFLHRGFWWTILEYKMHFTLFFMWVFPFEVSHIKFLMRQCQHKGICYIIYFSPPGFFWKVIFDAYRPYGQGVFRLRLWVYLKGSNNIGYCISWCFSLFFPLGFKEFCLVYRYYFGFPIGFFKDS